MGCWPWPERTGATLAFGAGACELPGAGTSSPGLGGPGPAHPRGAALPHPGSAGSSVERAREELWTCAAGTCVLSICPLPGGGSGQRVTSSSSSSSSCCYQRCQMGLGCASVLAEIPRGHQNPRRAHGSASASPWMSWSSGKGAIGASSSPGPRMSVDVLPPPRRLLPVPLKLVPPAPNLLFWGLFPLCCPGCCGQGMGGVLPVSAWSEGPPQSMQLPKQ